MAFFASFVCVDCICLVKGFLAQAAICSVFRAELRWRHNKKGCSTDAVECRLYSGQGKEQNTWTDCFCCLLKRWMLTSGMDPFRNQPSAQVFLLASFHLSLFFFFFFKVPPVFSGPLCSAVLCALTCPASRGQPCACFSFFFFLVLVNRKIMPKVCLCIGSIVWERLWKTSCIDD